MIITPYETEEDIYAFIDSLDQHLLGYDGMEYKLVYGVCYVGDLTGGLRQYGDSAAMARQNMKGDALNHIAFYREEIKKKLSENKEAEAKNAKENAVIDAIIEGASMDIPDAMLETQQRQMVQDYAQRLQSQGVSMEQYMQFTGMTTASLMEQAKPSALRRIQSRLVLEAVVAAENIEASEEEFEEEVKTMAESYQMEADKVKELLGDNGRKQVLEDICIRKAVQLVVDNARETEAAAE